MQEMVSVEWIASPEIFGPDGHESRWYTDIFVLWGLLRGVCMQARKPHMTISLGMIGLEKTRPERMISRCNTKRTYLGHNPQEDRHSGAMNHALS